MLCNKNLPIPICNSCDGKIYYFHYIYSALPPLLSLFFRLIHILCYYFFWEIWKFHSQLAFVFIFTVERDAQTLRVGCLKKMEWIDAATRPMLQWTIFLKQQFFSLCVHSVPLAFFWLCCFDSSWICMNLFFWNHLHTASGGTSLSSMRSIWIFFRNYEYGSGRKRWASASRRGKWWSCPKFVSEFSCGWQIFFMAS